MKDSTVTNNQMLLFSVSVLAIAIALLAGASLLDQPAVGILGGALGGSGVVLLARVIWARYHPRFAKKIELDIKDERQKQIYTYAGNAAFWITLLGIFAAGIVMRTEHPVLLFAPSVVLFVYLGCALYYHKKF